MKMKNHPIYEVWRSMIKRCSIPKRKDYKWYGARGISVCDEWKTNFWKFVEDMYGTYQKGLTLDRINNNLNYNKENCRWATQKEQVDNQRSPGITKKSSTKIKGINKRGDKFIIRMSIKGKRIHLEIVNSLEEGIKLLKENGYA